MSSIIDLFSLFLCAVTIFLIAEAAIPDSRYRLSISVGCTHSLMERKTSFNNLTLCAYVNISQTRHTYYALESGLLSIGSLGKLAKH